MKTIIIVRHAKSSWEDFSLSDHDRPLLNTGVKRTELIADYLAGRGVEVDLFLSSTAVRAHDTAKIIAEKLNYPASKIETNGNLYHGSANDIFNELYGLSDDIKAVMVFGHNPSFTYFVNHYLSPTIENLPTSGTVSINFETDKWAELDSANFHVNFMVTPKKLRSK